VCIFESSEVCIIVAVAGGVKMTCGFVLLTVLLWTSFQSGVQVSLISFPDIQALRVPIASRNYEGYIHNFPSM
jgi:hypothetical protein